jgi:hypothetical protein
VCWLIFRNVSFARFALRRSYCQFNYVIFHVHALIFHALIFQTRHLNSINNSLFTG